MSQVVVDAHEPKQRSPVQLTTAMAPTTSSTVTQALAAAEAESNPSEATECPPDLDEVSFHVIPRTQLDLA